MYLVFSTRQACIVLMSAGAQRRERPPTRESFFPVSESTPDATATLMARSHNFTPPRQGLARLTPLVLIFSVFVLLRWSETSVSVVSSTLKCQKCKGLLP